MKPYFEILQELREKLEEGAKKNSDSIEYTQRFGVQKRFDLKNNRVPGLWSITASFDAKLRELFMFIAGITNTKVLTEAGITCLAPYFITPESLESSAKKLVENKILSPQDAEDFVNQSLPNVGFLGPVYGYLWRYFPSAKGADRLAPWDFRNTFDELPSDAVAAAKKEYAAFPEEERKLLDFKRYAVLTYHTYYDQLGRLISNLKKDPYSRQHLVTCFHPDFTPLPGFSPAENAGFGFGYEMPRSHSFQVSVLPPETPESKKRLSLLLNVREASAVGELPSIITEYSTFAHLLANAAGMEADEFVLSVGHVIVNPKLKNFTYETLVSLIDDFSKSKPVDDDSFSESEPSRYSAKIKISPEKTDLFALKPEDIQFLSEK